MLEVGMRKRALVSIVDDDESVRAAAKSLMESLGFAAETFASAEDFLNSSRHERAVCLITDVQMPGMTGIELHQQLVASEEAIPTILITGYPDEEIRARALKAGVASYLTKPLNESELLASIYSILDRGDACRGRRDLLGPPCR
jgi:FixJ family two-component response regulator